MTIEQQAQFVADLIDTTILHRHLLPSITEDQAQDIAMGMLESEGWNGRRYTIAKRLDGKPWWAVAVESV